MLPCVIVATMRWPPPTLISISSLTAPATIALTVPTSWLRALDFIGCSSRNCTGAAIAMPASMWTTSSAKASTSAGSWVMRTIGSARRACSSRELGAQAVAQGLVERRERLVEQERARLAGERAGERDALALAARELVGKAAARAARSSSASSQRSTAAPPPSRRGLRQPRWRGRRRCSGARSGAGTARSPGTGSRSRAGAPACRCRARRRTASRRPSRCGRHRARTRPAITFSVMRLARTRRTEQHEPLGVAAERDVEVEAMRAAADSVFGRRRPSSAAS